MLSKRLVVVLSALLVFPSTALGADAGSGLTGPVYQAHPHEANWLTATGLGSGRFSFHDLGAGVIAGFGCTGSFGGAGAECAQADSGEALVFLEDRDDNFTSFLGGAIGAHVDGGTGNDHLVGEFADDRLSGGPGNDITDGGPGQDILDDAFTGLGSSDPGSGDDTQQGGEGDDTIAAGPGADTIDGGPQIDTVDYSSSTVPLTVTVDAGQHDDGAPGEGDTLTNVERILGGSGADVVVAGGAASVLVGGAGDDALRGGAGDDTLLGDDEAGGANSGNDTLDGGPGNDTFRTRDGEADRITCGDGQDRALLDEVDVIADATAEKPNGSCEKVIRKAPHGNDTKSEDAQQAPKDANVQS
jgi:Ca2+-binding RTX toxin-like protein